MKKNVQNFSKVTFMLLLTFNFQLFTFNCVAQTPQSFSYQAVVRDVNGNIIQNQLVSFQFSILESSATGNVVYEETQQVTTNNLGLVVLAIGNGSVVQGTFSTISWGSATHFLKVELDIAGGINYIEMGTTQLLSVPYSLYSQTAGNVQTYTAGNGISLTGNVITNTAPDQTVILNGTGATTVSGTYPNFTINSTDNNTTYSAGNGINVTGTTITNTAPDQTVNLTQGGATTISGTYPNFTISSTDNNTTYSAGTGLTLTGTTFSHNAHSGDVSGTTALTVTGIQNKPVSSTAPTANQVLQYNGTNWAPTQPSNLINAGNGLNYSGNTLNSVWTKTGNNIYNNNAGRVGIGMNAPTGKLTVQGDTSNILFEVKDKNGYSVFVVYQDSVQVFVNASGSKTNKGSFAINPKAQSKNNNTTYFEINVDTSMIINPSQNRILWYPTKSALLSGKVLIESPDSVGTNSFASGFESKSIGNQSQALGYKPIARGNYSTAIGYQAIAKGPNSYAFGNNAYSGDSASYAIGSGAKATGLRSFAVGSSGIDSLGTTTNPTIASGDYSYAFGMGSQAIGTGAFAFGTQDTASGNYSLAMGYKTKSNGWYSTTTGYKTTANGVFSVATGYCSTASGWSSTALGENTIASGQYSTAMGNYAIASGAYSVAMGSQTTASGDVSTAMGLITKASGTWSMATGILSNAKGNCSMAMGNQVTASGSSSTAMGVYTTAKPYASFVFGRYNDTTCISQTTWNASDPLFIIGNGSDDNSRSNAMTVLKNGNVGIGTTNPSTILHLYGSAQPELSIESGQSGGRRWTLQSNGNGSFTTTFQIIDRTAGASRLGIDNNGNVGIGTTTPGEKLEINGNLKFTSGAPYISNGNNRQIMQCGWSGTWGDFTAINSAYDWQDANEPGSIIASGGYPLVVTKGNSGTPFSTTLMTVNSNGNVSMPFAYSTIVGSTNRDLYIDNTGLVGYVSSSLRYKNNITDMENIDWLYKLRLVNYIYKTDSLKRKQYGLIAEEVEKINPLFVSYNPDGTVETVSYSSFISPMLKALQEQKNINDEQQKQIEALKSENAELKSKTQEIDQLKAEVEKIKTQLNASVMK